MTKGELVYQFVNSKIHLLQKNEEWDRAMLAKLRRGAGKDPSETPEIWEVTLAGLPEELVCRQSDCCKATAGEQAVHAALTLFALHQQGSTVSVDVAKVSFATAARRLMNGTNDDAIKRRFDAAVTATDISELVNHARGLVQLMKAAEKPIGFDYPQFAKDLYVFQFPEGKGDVRLRWGQNAKKNEV